MNLCQNKIHDLGALFFQERVAFTSCKRPATWSVTVNPPRAEKNGKVLLCDECNRHEYRWPDFPRAPVNG